MMNCLLRYMIKASMILSLMLVFSCATYNHSTREFYDALQQEQFEKAYKKIDHTRLLKKKRNHLLYLLEKGKMAHMIGDYAASNTYFNEADLFFEEVRTSVKDVMLSNVMNPMMETYKGESFEKFMVHYYKALNYLYLQQPDEALVEARRISLSNYALEDKSSKYSNDAFGLMLQGIIYEYNRDMNNAFIAYRNAVDLFLKHKDQYYGVTLPLQLKQDLLRTAYANGFHSELSYYERLFNMHYDPSAGKDPGELIVFWENGRVPLKVEENLFFSMMKDGTGNYYFVDQAGLFHVPFDRSYRFNDDADISSLRMLRIAFPRYEDQPLRYYSGHIEVDKSRYRFEKAEDVNTLARKTLQERFLKEAGKALSRIAVKKITEELIKPKNDTSKNQDLEKAIHLGVQLFNSASEKADTRHWQSLPNQINYARVPLKQGLNKVQFKLGDMVHSTFEVDGKAGLQVRNICTF